MKLSPLAALLLLLASACASVRPAAPAAYSPVSRELYATIAGLDSAMFAAYNQHDVAKLQTFFAADLEFYHDKGGLTNYRQTMDAFQGLFDRNKTSGLNRQRLPGTLEVYPIANYGAVETCLQRFCHVENGKDDCGTFKNVMVWQYKDGQWKVTRVISYDH